MQSFCSHACLQLGLISLVEQRKLEIAELVVEAMQEVEAGAKLAHS